MSDRGSAFMSDLFKHMISDLGTEHRFTMGYHPQTNATERVNRTLKTSIRVYVGTKHNSWAFFPTLPLSVLYCRELDTPLDLISQPDSLGVEDLGLTWIPSRRHLIMSGLYWRRITLRKGTTMTRGIGLLLSS